jgi:pimeloyl-ACP methyl ester carboxylesterase
VAVDWRGQGATPRARDGYDMDTLAGDAAAIIASLGVGAVHYVGLSMGGFVGMRLGARHPELIKSLTLVDTSADPEEPAAALQDKFLALLFRAAGLGPVRRPVEKIMFGPAFLGDPRSAAVIDEWMSQVAKLDRAGVRQAVLGVANRTGVLDELAKISAPTLVVVGEHDKPTPVAKARRIQAGIAGSRLEIVPDCGHSSTIEQPDALTRLISAFLDDLG